MFLRVETGFEIFVFLSWSSNLSLGLGFETLSLDLGHGNLTLDVVLETLHHGVGFGIHSLALETQSLVVETWSLGLETLSVVCCFKTSSLDLGFDVVIFVCSSDLKS